MHLFVSSGCSLSLHPPACRVVLLGGLAHLATAGLYALEDGGMELPDLALGGWGPLGVPQVGG